MSGRTGWIDLAFDNSAWERKGILRRQSKRGEANYQTVKPDVIVLVQSEDSKKGSANESLRCSRQNEVGHCPWLGPTIQ